MLTVFFMKLQFLKNFNYHIHKMGKGSADIVSAFHKVQALCLLSTQS